MPVFEYRGFTATGRAARGIVDAETAKAARLKLRREGIYPTEVREEGAGGLAAPVVLPLGRRRGRVATA
ncbi:MAG TPA: hypothetical protein VNM66_07310, partial [Thermodesulfobacteriota bacterium]|nr:hypothetical protein [Thermodesulfobacteriota bacterium]